MLKIACLSAALALSAVFAPARQTVVELPRRDNSQQKTGASVIRGRVLAADTGSPLRRATISIGSADLCESRVIYTDDQGRYEIKELPPGRYNLSALKGGYVSLSYGQSPAFQPGKPLQLKDNEILERVDFTLPRGGVITGRVTDEFGEPVVNAAVSTHRSELSPACAVWHPRAEPHKPTTSANSGCSASRQASTTYRRVSISLAARPRYRRTA